MIMRDYKKINVSHRLSSYEIKLPYWHGSHDIRKPFLSWASGESLPWYKAYNATKHDRHESFHLATFNQMIEAMGGLVITLSAQFYTYDFIPGNDLLALQGPNDGMEWAIGDYFRIKFPSDWPTDHQYDFDWQSIEHEPDPFQEFDYSII